MENDSEVIFKGPCDKCGSRDNKAHYSDGHSYCFSPGCGYSNEGVPMQVLQIAKPTDLIEGDIFPIPPRCITQETCKRWNYQIGKHHGEMVHIATYCDDNGLAVAQKIRKRDKSFYTLGDGSKMGLYGKHLAQGKGRRLIIVEGELDALSVSQAMNYKWPVVSLPRGAGSARKAITQELAWLSQFEEVVLCFDMDEAGQEALKSVLQLFPPGKLSIVTLPLKDANEMLREDRLEELVRCLWGAKPYRPDGLVAVSDLIEDVMKDPEVGMPWFLAELNRTTYGRRLGEAVALGAGTGVGKTTFLTQQISQDLQEGHAVGIFAFEQQPAETIKRVAGMMQGKTYHVPDCDKQGLREAVEELATGPGLHLYDHFGACDWSIVKERIRYLAHAHDVKIFYLDHLTALAAQEDDERRAIERMMADIGGLVQELNIWLLFVSHLATPDGKPHEEGGRVMARHFKGSRSIGYWSHFMLGIERAQQAETEEERQQSVLRCLKDRYTGRATGQTITLGFSHLTGRFIESEPSMFEDTSCAF